MIGQCISAVCTLGVVILAILIMTRAISLDDAIKIAGKVLLLLVILSFAVCMIGPPLHAGLTALAHVLQTILKWLVVAVIVIALLILFIQTLRWKYSARPNVSRSRNGGEW
jgi:protein-S-isoprenylcysteine O-methyltransferase Ste14